MSKVRPLKVGATYDDLCAVPENLVAEMFDGELYASPRPPLPHAHASSVLGFELGGSFHRGRHGPGGWWILDEPELHFGADVLVPDLAGWRRGRLESLPATPYFTLAPDWICEVLSPSTEMIDRAKKLGIYARADVPHAWLVNPGCRRSRCSRFRRAAGRWWRLTRVARRSAPVRAEPFDAIELELGALWA